MSALTLCVVPLPHTRIPDEHEHTHTRDASQQATTPMGGGNRDNDDDEPHLELTPSFELVVPKPKLPANRKKGQLGVSNASRSPDLISLVFIPELRAMFSGRCAPRPPPNSTHNVVVLAETRSFFSPLVPNLGASVFSLLHHSIPVTHPAVRGGVERESGSFR